MESNTKLVDVFINGPIDSKFIGERIAVHQSKTTIGAHHIFLGQVRADILLDKQVAAIDFTCYKGLALKKMQKIREDIFQQYALSCLHVYHSLGYVAVGEICLFVFVSAPHRKSAAEACVNLVDRLKSELPIWGREIFSNDSYQWKENM